MRRDPRQLAVAFENTGGEKEGNTKVTYIRVSLKPSIAKP